jgi:trimeric autotransporter adhesin
MYSTTGNFTRRIVHALAAFTLVALSQTTRANAPFAFTQFAYSITQTNAALQGMATPNAAPTSAWFEWGTDTDYGNQTPSINVGSGTQVVLVTNQINGLLANTTYHFRLVSSNADGVATGADNMFAFGRRIAYWGMNYWKQTNTPPGLTNIVAVSAAANITVALLSDGTVADWGYNLHYETTIPTDLTNVIAIDGGGEDGLALRADRTVSEWGNNDYGQTNVPPGLTNIAAVNAGEIDSLALKADGTVVAWGDNTYGQTNVPAGLSNVVAISCGGFQNAALKNDGTIVVWGSHAGTNVPPGLTNIVAIGAGEEHVIALSKTGKMYVWGDNTYGQTNAPASLTNVIQIAAGVDHSLAMRADGSVVGWGINNDGEATVPTTLTNVVSISAGNLYSLALAKNFPPVATNTRISTIANADRVIALSATDANNDALYFRIAALPSNGALYQYSNGTRGPAITTAETSVTDTNGQVIFAPGTDEFATPYTTFQFVANDGNLDSSNATVTIDIPVTPYANTQAAIGITSTNLILQGAVSPHGLPSTTWFEWGTNSNFGNRTDPINTAPGVGFCWVTNQLSITNGIVYHYRVVCSNAVGIAIGNERICGFQGHVWGLSLPVINGLTNITAVAAGPANFFAMRDDGSLVSWGFASLAVPTTISNVAAIAENNNAYLTLHNDRSVSLWGSGFTCLNCYSGVGAIGVGYNHELFVQTNGNLVGTGANSAGQATVPPNLGNIVGATGSQYCSVVVRDDGTVAAWGGYENITNVPPGLTNVVTLACGDYQCMALLRDGTLRIWGTPLNGNLIIPSAATNIVAIASGAQNCYALRNDGQLFAWGGFNTNVPAGLSNIVAIATGQNGPVVIAADGAPVANPQTVTSPANQDTVITLTASDPNTDTLTYRVTALPTNGTLYQYTPTGRGTPITTNDTLVTFGTKVIFAPPPNVYGLPMASIQFAVNDGIYDSAPATVTINVRGLPDVTTEPPNFLPGSNVILRGAVVANNFQTSVWFDWGTNTTYGNQTAPVSINGQSVTWVANTINGLAPRTTYHYRVAASNANGTSYGFDHTFCLGRKIITWGDNSSATTNVPAGVSNIVAAAAGISHNLVLRDDGKVIAWGDNSYGQTNVPPRATNVVAVAANYLDSLALRADGSVVAWGNNSSGQTNVPTALSNVVAVAIESGGIFALQDNGVVDSWNGGLYTHVIPPTNVVAIAAGGAHLLALLSDGTVTASGDNTHGQTNVPAGLNNVVMIAAGASHSVALKSDGTVVAWGLNNTEQATVPPGLSNVIAIAAGANHNLALLADGTARQWGGTNTVYYLPPASALPPQHLDKVTALDAGGTHNLAIGTIGDAPIIWPFVSAQPGVSNATLSGSVTGQFQTTAAWFDWGLTTNYGQTTILTNIGNTGNYITVSNTLTGLSPATIYHYRLHATNSEAAALGADNTFTTMVPPFSVVPIFSGTRDTLTFTFDGPSNATYTVLTATNIDGQWLPLGPMPQPTPGTFQFTTPFDPNAPTHFYRVQWP